MVESTPPGEAYLLIRSYSPAPGIGIVRPLGRLEALTAPQLLEHLKFRLHDGPGRHVVLDLQDVAAVDSAGITALLAAHREAADGEIAFHITGADPLLLAAGLPVLPVSTEELVERLAHPRTLLTAG
ncbi:STAS domain-containing protein [Pseudonocardia nigra]|uniref:STAS domain-containing protein n=1 Tax=Pseudonocardia nigra TaxID=1921578 RepID=UPI001C5D268A|nr:STAS domain-containing protein [Pseudonocardia nigra]